MDYISQGRRKVMNISEKENAFEQKMSQTASNPITKDSFVCLIYFSRHKHKKKIQ